MSPVIGALAETVAVAGLALFGVAVGRWCGRQRRPYWLAGYIVPLAIVMLISSARWLPRLETALPFRWLMAGRTEFALLALSPETVTTGDPLVGRPELTRDEFNKKWRRCGIVLDNEAITTAR